MPRALGIGIGMPFGGGVAFSPLALFAASEQGVWYDPSDFSTMFQDSAGTTPVTAVEQNVGLIQDKSGNGNHASQATSGSRPVLRARYNLLTYSEQIDNAAWTKGQILAFGSGSVANAITAPDGTLTADLVVPSTANNNHFVNATPTVAGTTTAHRHSVCVKAAGYSKVALRESASTGAYASFNLDDRTVIETGNAGAITVSNAAITSLGDGWYRISCDMTPSPSSNQGLGVWFLPASYTTGAPTTAWVPNGTSGMYVWGADLRVTNDGVGLPAYQRIAAATDYDTVGFPPYLLFDGTDDSMATAAIDFSATDEMTVVAGVRKLSDAATGAVVELTTNSTTTTNSFLLAAPVTGSSYAFGSHGDDATRRDATIASATFPAPHTAVLCGLADISGDSAIVRANGVQYGQNTSEQGAGNFANNILSIGRRSSSTLFLNGRLFSLIVRGKTSTADEIAAAETWVNSKTGAY